MNSSSRMLSSRSSILFRNGSTSYNGGSLTNSSTFPNLSRRSLFHTSVSNPNAASPPSSSNTRNGSNKEKSKSSILSPLSPSIPPPSNKEYNPLTVSLVKGVAKLMGYNSTTSTAIRVSSDLYDRCAERTDVERDFWYKECSLPPTYQTWFQLTNLHVWLLLVRFRSLPSSHASSYSQEITNHFFIDSESRMRERFGIQTGRLVKGYMKDMHMQQRGSILGLDEALANGSDEKLATALWRNLYGGGWGKVDGVKRKIRGIDKTMKGEDPNEDGLPDLAKDLGALSIENNPYVKAKELESRDLNHSTDTSTTTPTPTPSTPTPTSEDATTYSRGDSIQDANQRAELASNSPSEDPLVNRFPELAFPIQLERITVFVRKELKRLGNLSDEEIMSGRTGGVSSSTDSIGAGEKSQSIAAFGRI